MEPELKIKTPLSRLGRKPVDIPSGVKVFVENQTVHVQGSRGNLSWTLPSLIHVQVQGNKVQVNTQGDGSVSKAMHGTSRKLILNMVEGVSKGFEKRLIIEGVGFRAQISSGNLVMTLGFSHPTNFPIPKDVVISSDPKTPNLLTITGNDKQRVGEVAAQIRAIKSPEPYKGTGIRYQNEVIKRKAGKAAVGATTGGGGGGGGKK